MALKIRELRKARGWTQEQLADKAGVSRSYLTEIETGAKTVNMRRLDAIAIALGVETPALIDIDTSDPDVQELVANFKSLPPEDQKTFLDLSRRFSGFRPDD